MFDKIIEILKYILIGIIQGISEILPISSSGHLYLAYNLLDISSNNQLDITIYLHFASSLALCIFFKDKIKSLIYGSFLYVFKKDRSQKESFYLLLYIIIATIPAAIIGLLLEDVIDKYCANTYILSLCFLITSILLIISSKIKSKDNSIYTFKNTITVGLFQCLAIFPGISRSGTTMLAGKLSKLDLYKQKELSFMLLIPISAGAFILSLIKNPINFFTFNHSSYLYVVSMICAFITTFLSLKFLFSKTKDTSFRYYSIYLFILSLIILFFSLI